LPEYILSGETTLSPMAIPTAQARQAKSYTALQTVCYASRLPALA